MSNNQEHDLIGIWEQVGFLNPTSKAPRQWSPGSPNASVREFYVFFGNGRCMFARFSAKAKVEFDLLQQSFVNIDEAQNHMKGNYSLSGKILTEEYKYEKTYRTSVNIGDLSEQQFTILEKTPDENLVLEIIYHKSAELPENDNQLDEKVIELINPWDYVLPKIQPYEWAGQEGSIHRSLCFLPRKEGTPWVSFYRRVGNWFIYKRNGSETNETHLEIEQKAIANLSEEPIGWRSLNSDASGNSGIICALEPFAAERILDRESLLEARSILETDIIVAAIPYPDSLFLSGDLKKLLEFIAVAVKNEEENLITPWVFTIQDGLVTGICSYGDNGEIIIDHVFIPPEYS